VHEHGAVGMMRGMTLRLTPTARRSMFVLVVPRLTLVLVMIGTFWPTESVGDLVVVAMTRGAKHIHAALTLRRGSRY